MIEKYGRNYLLEKMKQSEFMTRNYKKICTALSCVEHFLTLACTITRYISISAFSSLIGIPKAITSSVIRLKICVLAAGIKNYKSIIKKKKKKHDKMVFLVLISKALIDSVIRHGEFFW